MGAPAFFDLFQVATFELVVDNPKGHQSDFAPSIRKRNDNAHTSSSSSSSPVSGPKKKLQLCRWDSSSAECNSSPTMPLKPGRDSPPSLKRMLSPPPACTLHNVLKPVRRLSFEKQLDDICGANTTKSMSTADILNSVLSHLDLLDDDDDEDDDDQVDSNDLFDNFPQRTSPRCPQFR